MLRPPGKWGLLGALDLEAQLLQVADVQPARAQRHLWPAQPRTPSCLRPQRLLPPPRAQSWSDSVPRGLLLQQLLLRLQRRFLTRCPLLWPSRIKSQGHWGACVQCLVLCRGKEQACRAEPGGESTGSRCPGCSRSIAPCLSLFNRGPCKPQPSRLPLSGVPWGSHAGLGWLCPWRVLAVARFPSKRAGSACSALHTGRPHALPLWLSIPGLPLAPLLPRAGPLSAVVPCVSGCTHSPPACPIHRNADTFAQHSCFARLHARKGVKSP